MASMGCLNLLFISKKNNPAALQLLQLLFSYHCGHGTQVMAACLRGEEWEHSLSLFQELKCWNPELCVPVTISKECGKEEQEDRALQLCWSWGFAASRLCVSLSKFEIQLRPECYVNTAILCGGFRQLSPGSMSQHHMQSLHWRH